MQIINNSRKGSALAKCTISLTKACFTPLHLELHYNSIMSNGQTTLIKSRNSHGFCTSRTEVRIILVSLASLEGGAAY